MFGNNPKKTIGIVCLVTGAFITICNIVAYLTVFLDKENFIIEEGIKAYNNWHIAAPILISFGLALFIFGAILGKPPAPPKEDKEYNPVISEEEGYRIRLRNAAEGEWAVLGKKFHALCKQSMDIDSFQDKLSTLLTSNDADILSDTEDALNAVEHAILENIKSVLNYSISCSSVDPAGVDKVSKEATIAIEKNDELLSKAGDFLMALTDYLNGQEKSGDISLLDEYKNILEAPLREWNKEQEQE